MSDVTTTFGERLHHLRRALELSAERMARRFSVSDQTVYRWQRLSEPYPPAVKAVRSAFPHVRAAWLTHGEEPVFSSAPPHGLEEQGRSVCLTLTGPGGRVLARVELVLMGPAQPAEVPLSLPGSSQDDPGRESSQP